MRWRTLKLSHTKHCMERMEKKNWLWLRNGPVCPRTHWKRWWWWALKSVRSLKWNNKRTCSRNVYITMKRISIISSATAAAVASVAAATHKQLYNKSLLKAQIIFTTHSFTYWVLLIINYANCYGGMRILYIVVDRTHIPRNLTLFTFGWPFLKDDNGDGEDEDESWNGI